MQTGLGLQLEVQLVPTMQVFLRLDPAHRGQMCGEAPWAWRGVVGARGAGLRALLRRGRGTGRVYRRQGLGRQLSQGTGYLTPAGGGGHMALPSGEEALHRC